jgi:hypothetical protein
MSNLLSAIKDLLPEGETAVYIGQFPEDGANNCCTITQIPGRPSIHVFDKQEAVFRQPTIQIRVRDTSFDNGYGRCEDIIEELDGYHDSGIRSILLESDIVTLGNDLKNRSEFILLFKILY